MRKDLGVSASASLCSYHLCSIASWKEPIYAATGHAATNALPDRS